MYDWNAPAHPSELDLGDVHDESAVPRMGDAMLAVDSELEAAIEYKLAISGYAGVADIIEAINRSVRRRFACGDWT